MPGQELLLHLLGHAGDVICQLLADDVIHGHNLPLLVHIATALPEHKLSCALHSSRCSRSCPCSAEGHCQHASMRSVCRSGLSHTSDACRRSTRLLGLEPRDEALSSQPLPQHRLHVNCQMRKDKLLHPHCCLGALQPMMVHQAYSSAAGNCHASDAQPEVTYQAA